MWHHQLYKANKANNTLRLAHIWFGRLLIILGMVNGGTGLYLVANSPGGEKAYGSLAGIIGVIYILLVLLWYFKGDNGAKDVTDTDASGVERRGENRQEIEKN